MLKVKQKYKTKGDIKMKKQVNLVALFLALGYANEKTAKTQKTSFLKKSMGYEDDDAKSALTVDVDTAQKIVDTFIANVKTEAQIARSEIAKTIDLSDEKFYVAPADKTDADVIKDLKATITSLKKENKELLAKIAELESDVDDEDYDAEDDFDDSDEEDGEED